VYDICVLWYAGMMGSGKTTVGKILAEVLGYSFFDRFVFLSDNELYPPPKSSISNLCFFGLWFTNVTGQFQLQ